MSETAQQLDADDFVPLQTVHLDARTARFFPKPTSHEWFQRTAESKGMIACVSNFGGRKYLHVPTFLALVFSNTGDRNEAAGSRRARK